MKVNQVAGLRRRYSLVRRYLAVWNFSGIDKFHPPDNPVLRGERQ
jgi:hypothetical protein